MERYDEAIFAYQKALNTFKSCKGENHPSVASVFVRLADLYNKIGKFSESKSYCENALRIYSKPMVGSPPEEIASGLVDISTIYESMNEPDLALELLQKAIKAYGNAPGQQSIIAGIEAQMGVLYYILGRYSESYNALKNATMQFRSTGEKKSALFGFVLNQMGLVCVQLFMINKAAGLFEEARNILETECGHYHADAIGGLDDLRDWTNNVQPSIPIYTAERNFEVMKKTHYYLVDTSSIIPGAAVSDIQFNIIQEKPFIVHDLQFTPLPVWHDHGYRSLGFCFGNICYISP